MASFEPRPSRIWSGGIGLWPHHAGLARLQWLASTALPCFRSRRCPDLRRRCDSVRSECDNGSSRPWCGLSCLRLTVRTRNRRSTEDLQWLGQFFRAVLPAHRGGDRLCAPVIGMVTGKAETVRPHSIGHFHRFLYPRTGVLSLRHRQFFSEVDSTKSDVLGSGPDCFVRTRCRGYSCQSNGASGDSPTENDAC